MNRFKILFQLPMNIEASIAKGKAKSFGKIIFEFQKCHFARIEKLPKWHFWSVDGIWNFFGPNDFIWDAMKVPFSTFIQKMSEAQSSSVQVLIWENKLDYLKNPSQNFKTNLF